MIKYFLKIYKICMEIVWKRLWEKSSRDKIKLNESIKYFERLKSIEISLHLVAHVIIEKRFGKKVRKTKWWNE